MLLQALLQTLYSVNLNHLVMYNQNLNFHPLSDVVDKIDKLETDLNQVFKKYCLDHLDQLFNYS